MTSARPHPNPETASAPTALPLPLVSIIIPVHNGGRFLPAAIDSALAQTYTHAEVIVVDDGSTDDTADILAAYGSSIAVMTQQRAGVATSRNRAIERSRGELVALLDADDVWVPTKLERQVAAWRARPDAGLVLCGYDIVDEALRVRYRVPCHSPSSRVRRAQTLDAWGLGLSFTAVFPRWVVDHVGGFRRDLSTSADLEFCLRVADRYPVIGVPECLARYRSHDQQMHLDGEQMEADMIAVLAPLTSSGDRRLRRLGRRGMANLHTRRACDELRRACIRGTARHVWRAMRLRPDRLVAAPMSALGRRARYRLLSLGRQDAAVGPPR